MKKNTTGGGRDRWVFFAHTFKAEFHSLTQTKTITSRHRRKTCAMPPPSSTPPPPIQPLVIHTYTPTLSFRNCQKKNANNKTKGSIFFVCCFSLFFNYVHKLRKGIIAAHLLCFFFAFLFLFCFLFLFLFLVLLLLFFLCVSSVPPPPPPPPLCIGAGLEGERGRNR